MKNLYPFTVLSIFVMLSNYSFGQMTYQDANGNTHLAGPFALEILEQDTLYNGWYDESYQSFQVSEKDVSWKAELEDISVEIYLGTWCGDSKNWVPKFVKLWDSLGLAQNQLHFTALYNGDEKYKQGPNHEEEGLRIHRVPTFIFKRDGAEFARIVETPRNDLETDLAQIALGYPSEPNYRAATYLTKLLEKQTVDSVYKDFRKHIYEAYELVSKVNELNT
ncbi:MAG: hypothetical protein AAFN93_01735, partial [Bacteroidota bacterium]